MARPTPLVTLRHRLYAFAQDGGRIAWAIGPCGAVTIRQLDASREYGFHGELCDSASGSVPQGFGSLALGGARAVWWTWWHGNDYHQDVGTGVVGSKADYPVVETDSNPCDQGGITAVAADGAVAVFATVDVWGPDEDPCGLPATKGGGVFLAQTGKRLPGVSPAVAVAVSGSLLAVVPLDPSRQRNSGDAVPNGPVEVYDIRARKLRGSVQPSGTATAVAISPSLLALMAEATGGVRIEWFDPRSGTELGSTAVAADVAPPLSVSGTRIVYSSGKRIWVLDSKNGKRSVLTNASATPIGLSIEGSRVAWGENIAGRGRIMALELPVQ